MGQNVTTERIILYVRALDDLSLESVEFAFDRALRHCKFFPTPGELREFALEWRPVVDESRAILARGIKPEGWVPLEDFYDELKKALHVQRPTRATTRG